MFHHVGISLVIATKGKYHFSVSEQYGECCTGGKWFNVKFCQSLHGPLFEEFFFTAHQEIYNIMCELYAYNKLKDNSNGATYFHGCRPLPEDSNVNPLISLFFNINFFDTCIYAL